MYVVFFPTYVVIDFRLIFLRQKIPTTSEQGVVENAEQLIFNNIQCLYLKVLNLKWPKKKIF